MNSFEEESQILQEDTASENFQLGELYQIADLGQASRNIHSQIISDVLEMVFYRHGLVQGLSSTNSRF